MSTSQENKPGKRNPFTKEGVFKGASPLVFELAKDLRRNMTQAEKILWMHLRTGVSGLKFRRQHPIGPCIADFYCHKIKLIIEADGLIHEKAEILDYDKKREGDLKDLGIHVLRFKNEEILEDFEFVLEKIRTEVDILFQSSIINQKQKASL
jgi:very-short-patch-repair endonuclease